MIINKDRLDSKPKWKESEYNRWADYVELLCLREEIITPDDLIDIWCDEARIMNMIVEEMLI